MASAIETVIRKAVGKGISVVADVNRRRLKAPAKHPYLTGIHTPMNAELTLENLAVTGTIPRELDGRYLRIGPNPVGDVDAAAYHWFVGDGMVHGVRLKGGNAEWYRNRWVRSERVSEALGEPAAPGPRNSLSDNANTNVVGHAGKTWALVEAGAFPVELADTLGTLAHNPFDGTLAGSFSAHPHRDPDSGELHAICYAAQDPTTIRHVVVGADGKVRREEPIPVSDGPSIHDCAITSRFVVILDLPVTFSMKALLTGYSFPYRWNPAHKARVGLLPRDGKAAEVIWCDVEPCYIFHPANAYELPDGRVVFDAAVHSTMFAESTQGPDAECVIFERWTIDPEARRVDRRVIDEAPPEFPRIDERRTGKPHRYAYTMALSGIGGEFEGATHLIRHDMETGARAIHDFGPRRFPGEFVFVPRSEDAAEDDGWLIGLVVDMDDETTDLAILNARDFEAPPVALVHLPHRVPPGFHGNWVAAG